MSENVTVLSFSSRENGNCAAICRFIENYYRNTKICSFKIDSGVVMACGDCDYECLRPGVVCPNLPEAYRKIMDRICASDLVYFVVPNYCGGPSGNYYVFNERSVGYFNSDREKMKRYMNVRKRFVIVSNTEGFEKAMQQQTNQEPEMLYLKTRQYQKQSIVGDLMDSEWAQADLKMFLDQAAL